MTQLENILGFSCVAPAVIGAYTILTKKDKSYTPFIIAMWVDVVVGILFDTVFTGFSKFLFGIALTFYGFINFGLYMWFFYCQDVIKQKLRLLLAITAAFVVIAVHFLYIVSTKDGFAKDGSFYMPSSILFAIVFFILGIRLLNNQFFQFRIPLNRNPKIIIAIGIIIFYIDFILIFSMEYFHVTNKIYLYKIFTIHLIVNALTYLIFAWGLLCIPNTKTYLQ